MARKEEKGKEEAKGTSKMTVEEAGRKGGETTKETHGREFYQDIGKKGGQTSGGERSSEEEETSERKGTARGKRAAGAAETAGE